MPLDFPNSPITGATYTGPNGVIWAWDGSKWVNGTQIGTAYAPVQSPVFTGNPTAPNPPSGDADTSVATTAFVSAAVAPAFNGVGRNLLHNPLFNVTQRGAGPFTLANAYGLDRWAINGTTDTVSASQLVMNDTYRAQIGDETAAFGLANTFTGNAAASSYNLTYQAIESVRRLAGKTVTVSFWALGSSALKLGVNLYQSFGTGGSPSAGAWIPTGQSVTLSTTFVRYSLTFNVPSASGMTLGTNNDNHTRLAFWYSAGTTFTAVSGSVGVQSGSIYIWGVQLEIGSVATPLEKPDPRYDLANCQRFYQGVNGALLLGGYGGAGGSFYGTWLFPVTMRASPTVVLSGQSYGNASGAVVNSQSASWFAVQSNVTAAGSGYAQFYVTASADL